jgi:NAD-dependent SIR2 family protein deacetylase
MRIIEADDALARPWKTYPIRIAGTESRCCGGPTILVQSMKGGFVTQNCSRCGKLYTLSASEFANLNLWVACPSCTAPMEPRILMKDYCYYCEHCELAIQLATLLPWWNDA